MEYKDTLNLPKTSFSMRADFPTLEARMLAKWDAIKQEPQRGTWFLHDGPPYANGDIHMGHLLNKVVKDIACRFQRLNQENVSFIPGWDCHGLPIETAVSKMEKPKDGETKSEFRQRCRNYALLQVDLQKATFKRLGISANWDRAYLTLTPQYEGSVLDVLANMYKYKLVYRKNKPVHWCCAHKTALAEAELEYADRTDTAMCFGFSGYYGDTQATFVVWTTTPWTLVANMAIAVNPNIFYHIIRCNDRTLIAAKNSPAYQYLRDTNEDWECIGVVDGKRLAASSHYLNPFTRKVCRVIEAAYVTESTGSGLVHIAPGHGDEDYALGVANNLEVYCPVDDTGTYDNTTKELCGKKVSDTNAVLFHLGQGIIFYTEPYTHSVHHCWRCKQPTITRATPQWFVAVNKDSQVVESIKQNVENIEWIPKWGKQRFLGTLENRPDWCISRQRSWGIPIPAFYQGEKVLMDEGVILRVANHFRKHGSDSWFTHSPEYILHGDSAGEYTDDSGQKWSVSALTKGTDILDVWFESGSSHKAVFGDNPQYGSVAVEGTDQHRGWFQSVALVSGAMGNPIPFKTIVTHGFLLAKKATKGTDKEKFSKSSGNGIKVQDALKKYGADVLRLWAASGVFTDDMVCDWDSFEKANDIYKKIRNTIKFLLSNLYDYNFQPTAIKSMDIYMIDLTKGLAKRCAEHYRNFEYYKVVKEVYDFCNTEVSAFYAKSIKDRLYCDAADSFERRSAQVTCFLIVEILSSLLYPIMPFTCEEILEVITQTDEHPANIRTKTLRYIGNETGVETKWDIIRKMLPDALSQLDNLKKTVGLGNSLDSQVVIVYSTEDAWLRGLGQDIEDALGVGYHVYEMGDTMSLRIEDTREKYPTCARSWKRRPDVGSDPEYPDLSARDAKVVRNLKAI